MAPKNVRREKIAARAELCERVAPSNLALVMIFARAPLPFLSRFRIGVFRAGIFQSIAVAETELLQRARAGEREAIAALFHRHRDEIYCLAFQILREREGAEDAAQEILLRAFEKMPAFRGESEFSTYLYRIALNYCLEVRRTAARRQALWQHAMETEGAVPTDLSGDFARRIDTRFALEQSLDSLPETLQIVLVLREWHDKNYQEIAAILGLPVGTVKSRLHQARREFRQHWEAQNAP